MKIPFVKNEISVPSLSLGKNPGTDWVLIFSLNILLIAGLIFTGYKVYKDISSADVVLEFSADGSRKDDLNVSDFSKIVRTFDEKKVTSTAIKNGSFNVPSPYTPE